MERISYLSEPDQEYCKQLADQTTLDDLRAFTKFYEPIAADAYEIAATMTEDDFKAFRAGLKKERRGKFAGVPWMERFGAVLLPAVMFEVGVVMVNYHVPFGLAYIRMREAGRLVEDERGVASLVQLPAKTSGDR